MKRNWNTAAAFAASWIIAGPAAAAVVTLDNILGEWFDATPAANVTSNTGGGTAHPQVAWGASGYNFDAAAPLPISILVPPTPSADFVLGSFTHINQPIPSGSGITSIRLKISADVAVDGNAAGNKFFIFDFKHDETDNSPDPCPFGGANFQGVNVNGCADRVGAAFGFGSGSFLIGSELYSIGIVGFEIGGNAVNELLTPEGANTEASLVARVDLLDTLLPAPGTLALLGLGLAGLGFSHSRRAS